MNRLLKGGAVVLGAVILSTIGIFAADTFVGIDRGLNGLSQVTTIGGCGQGMVLIRNGEHSFCADVFEASPSEDCPHLEPTSVLQSEENVSSRDCTVTSAARKNPWRFISLTQAQNMCATVGKRLPTSNEWYMLALGTRHESCVLDSEAGKPELTGTHECLSSSNVEDAVGNVWEWINGTVTDGSFGSRTLPRTGYVSSVDEVGVAITTSQQEQILYGSDYFWSKESGTFGIIRGGFYDSESDGGLYTVNTSVETSLASPGVGFRCVKDL